MLAIQSGIAKYHCMYTQGAVASQTSGVFFDSPDSTMQCNTILCYTIHTILQFKVISTAYTTHNDKAIENVLDCFASLTNFAECLTELLLCCNTKP